MMFFPKLLKKSIYIYNPFEQTQKIRWTNALYLRSKINPRYETNTEIKYTCLKWCFLQMNMAFDKFKKVRGHRKPCRKAGNSH